MTFNHNDNFKPKVSILISTYNGAKTLERCLNSVCSQTFQKISIVCIDDCSTDNTTEIIEKVKTRFPKIPFTVLKNEKNLGLTRSLNQGFTVIDSPYIARIDDDDWWESTKIEKQVAFLDTHPSHDIVGTNYINHAGGIEKPITLPETDKQIKKTIFWRNPFAHSAVMYRTEKIRSIGTYNIEVPCAQDYELWVRCFPKMKFYNIQEFLCHRSLGSGISIDRQNEQMRLYLNVLKTYLPKYHRPITEYGAMIEPLLVLATPNWIKKIKRRYLV